MQAAAVDEDEDEDGDEGVCKLAGAAADLGAG
jgi:hypothetical protein